MDKQLEKVTWNHLEGITRSSQNPSLLIIFTVARFAMFLHFINSFLLTIESKIRLTRTSNFKVDVIVNDMFIKQKANGNMIFYIEFIFRSN